jgi:hypothetical protein
MRIIYPSFEIESNYASKPASFSFDTKHLTERLLKQVMQEFDEIIFNIQGWNINDLETYLLCA